MPSEVKSAAGVEKGQRGAAEGLIKYLILKGDALGIVLLEPFFRGVCVCEHLDVLGIANCLLVLTVQCGNISETIRPRLLYL